MFFNQRSIFCRPQIPLCRKTLVSKPGLLRLWHWQSDAITTRLELIHEFGQISSTTRLDLIHKGHNPTRTHPHAARYNPQRTISARSHPHAARPHPQRTQLCQNSSTRGQISSTKNTTPLDIIHTRLDLIHKDRSSARTHPHAARSHPQRTQLCQISSTCGYISSTNADRSHSAARRDLIHNSARSHPQRTQLRQISSTRGQT